MIAAIIAICSMFGQFFRTAWTLVELAWMLAKLAFCLVGWVAVGLVWIAAFAARGWRWWQERREWRASRVRSL